MTMEGKALRNVEFWGQQAIQERSVTMEKSWVMMMDRTDMEDEL